MDDLERQKLEALAEFAAGAGHEINNPLAIIGGRAQLLLREIDHPEHRRQLGVIVAQVKRAYEMIADIRFFARPPQPEWTTFNLSDELKLLVAEQMPLMMESGVTFHADVDSVDQPMVKSDPVLLHVAVSVLCNNARESVTLTGGTVWLRLFREEDCWKIMVKDDGPGVSEEIRPLIFDPYYSGRQSGRGLGFGLPKAWRTMQLLGGSIRCEPESTFVLTLPSITETQS
ncbi:MAG: HAMP domain-containing histidine kinase [Planctomycetaceae bacterium]|jgi:signal transduction histidine kinase|nr:HAMP domain-containing histidine kinase [Planctomycetaceae bacterium]